MKRIHVHLRTRELDKARRFYTTLFGQGPTVAHGDYLKWRLNDPAINLAVTSGENVGLAHLGLDLESEDELTEVGRRLGEGGYTGLEEAGAHCCYALSDKVWSQDADGLSWESFVTHALRDTRDADTNQACCSRTLCGG